MKKIILFLLTLCLLPSLVFAQSPLQGYSKQDGYQYVTFGEYPQAADGKKEPILWRVLQVEEGIAYLLSEYVLDVHKLHDDRKEYPSWPQSDTYRWLHKDFLESAFTPEEVSALFETPDEGVVSLPSAADFKNKDMGFTDNKSRWSYGTPWAMKQGEAGLYVYRKYGTSPIWLRTPSAKQKHAQCATKLEGGVGYSPVHWKDIGIRPVIWVSLNQVTTAAGEGTMQSPLKLSPLPKP